MTVLPKATLEHLMPCVTNLKKNTRRAKLIVSLEAAAETTPTKWRLRMDFLPTVTITICRNRMTCRIHCNSSSNWTILILAMVQTWPWIPRTPSSSNSNLCHTSPAHSAPAASWEAMTVRKGNQASNQTGIYLGNQARRLSIWSSPVRLLTRT